MNQLMLEVRNHHVADEIVKLVKEYSTNSEKIMKRLQLTIFKHRKKMNRGIRATAVYILNDFKRAHSKTYFDLSAPTQKDLRAADLMIRDMKLIKNLQTNASSDDDFVESSSATASRADTTEVDTPISSTRTIVFKSSISKIASVTPRKASQAERIDQLSKPNVVSSAVNSISSQVRFFNLDKEILVSFINQDT